MGTRDPEELRRLGDGIDDRTLTRSDDVQNFSNAIAGYDRTAEPNDSDQQSLSQKLNRKSGPEPKIATRRFPMCYVPKKRPNRNQNPRKSLTTARERPENPDIRREPPREIGSLQQGACKRGPSLRSTRSRPIRVVSRDHAKSEPISCTYGAVFKFKPSGGLSPHALEAVGGSWRQSMGIGQMLSMSSLDTIFRVSCPAPQAAVAIPTEISPELEVGCKDHP